MTLLENHLEQISLSSAAIAELPFPSPRIFTNALLHSHDITALIRDTEAHERALFNLVPGERGARQASGKTASHTTFRGPNGTGEAYIDDGRFPKNAKNGSTVATLLGGELGEQIRQEGAKEGKERSEVDVELLLKGAEKLCGIYPIPGATERITSLRSRYEHLNLSIARYESKVSKQTAHLARMNRAKNGDDDFDEEHNYSDEEMTIQTDFQGLHVTEADLERENQEIRDLEKKKRTLEDRVSGMERDLGGLLR